jgi:hypothetical protein
MRYTQNKITEMSKIDREIERGQKRLKMEI